MRTFTLTKGKNKGNHYIFDTPNEARMFLSNSLKHLNKNIQDLKTFPHWSKGQPGDWVCSDDGRVLQVFKRTEFPNNGFFFSTRTGCWIGTIAVKVCCTTGNYYGKASGDIVMNRMDVDPKSLTDCDFKRSSIGKHKHVGGKYRTKSKVQFVTLLMFLGDPFQAYQEVYVKGRRVSQHNIMKGVFALLHDKYVIAEIKYQMEQTGKNKVEDLKTKLREGLNKVRLKSGRKLDIDRYLDELDEGLEACKKGTMSHKLLLEMLIKTITLADESSTKKKLGKEIDDDMEHLEEAGPSSILPRPRPELVEGVNNAKVIQGTPIETAIFEEIEPKSKPSSSNISINKINSVKPKEEKDAAD